MIAPVQSNTEICLQVDDKEDMMLAFHEEDLDMAAQETVQADETTEDDLMEGYRVTGQLGIILVYLDSLTKSLQKYIRDF